jgi:hypothetical protein
MRVALVPFLVTASMFSGSPTWLRDSKTVDLIENDFIEE